MEQFQHIHRSVNSNSKLPKKHIIIILFLLLLISFSQLISNKHDWIEYAYSNRIYPVVSKLLRLTFGWLPFSIGDLMYGIMGCYLIYYVIKKIVGRKKIDKPARPFFFRLLQKIIYLLLCYFIFLVLWGFNYYRLGIAHQLKLSSIEYDSVDLRKLNENLVSEVNMTRSIIARQNKRALTTQQLFDRAVQNYHDIKDSFPFIHYEHASVKPSLWGWLGNYLGFSGYYNPFTGEAQVNTTGPGFLHPFVASHEIAHQLGYAGEMEANFVGYLAAAQSKDTAFQYAADLEIFLYANQNYYRFDSVAARKIRNQLSKDVQRDLTEIMKFNRAHQSFLEPIFNTVFDLFLKSQHQKQGVLGYNEVVGLVIAYDKSKVISQK